MAFVVVALDVIRVERSGDLRQRQHAFEERGQCRIVDDAAQVALEVPVIDRVEAHERGEQADVGLGHAPAHQPLAVRQPGFQPVQRIEQRAHRLLAWWRSRHGTRRC